MAEGIGQLIKKVADEQGFSQKRFGEKINRTKQGVASIYRRATIDIELLKKITEVLNYDFFAHLYEESPLREFKDKESSKWKDEIHMLNSTVRSNEELLKAKEEALVLQRKYITELEEKIIRLQRDL